MTLAGVGSGGKGKESYGLAFSGAGAGSLNTIERSISSYIKGDTAGLHTIITGNAGDVVINAKDNSLILGNAGVLSVAVGIGGTTGLGGSIGASVIINVVKNSVTAYMSNVDVLSDGGVELEADSNAAIWALAIAGSLGVGVGNSPGQDGGGSSGTGVGVAISGATTINVINNSTAGYIEKSSVESLNNGNITVEAKDSLSIMADAGGISIAVGSGGNTGFGLSIGGSVAVNVVSNETVAKVTDSDLGTIANPAGDIIIDADSASRIWALTIAGSLSVGYGKNRFGGAVGGSVAGSVNVIHNIIDAHISDSATVKGNGVLTLGASDNTGIIANAIGGSIAVGAGSQGLGVAVGGAFAVNNIANKVSSYINGSTIDIDGDLSITSESDSSIWGLAIGAALSVGASSGGGTGASLSIGISVVDNRIGNVTEAYIKNASEILTGGNDVIVKVVDNAAIQAIAVSASIGAAISTGASGGGSGGGGKGGVGAAVSGGGAIAGNYITSSANSYIDNSILGTILNPVGNIDLDSISSSEILAIVPTLSASLSYGSKAGIGVAIGASVARNIIGSRSEELIIDYTSSDNVNSINTGDLVKVTTDGVWEGEVYEYVGSGIERSDYSADAGIFSPEAGDRVWVDLENSGAAAPGVYQYVYNDSQVSLEGEILDFDHDESDDDYDSIKWADNSWAEKGFAAGQRIDITGAGANTGTYTIESVEGETIYLVEDLNSDATGLTGAVVLATGTWDLQITDYQNAAYWTRLSSLDLGGEDFGDKDAWKRADLTKSGSEIQSYVRNSSIHASGDLTADAVASKSINSTVLAGAVALAGGGKLGLALSGAGVYAENNISSDVRAFINGDGSDGIASNSISLVADDSSTINSIAGAASVAGSVGGKAGVSVSIGLSLAFNTVDNQVEAYIANADDGIATIGDVSLYAGSNADNALDFDPGDYGFTFDDLDNASSMGSG